MYIIYIYIYICLYIISFCVVIQCTYAHRQKDAELGREMEKEAELGEGGVGRDVAGELSLRQYRWESYYNPCLSFSLSFFIFLSPSLYTHIYIYIFIHTHTDIYRYKDIKIVSFCLMIQCTHAHRQKDAE